MTIAAVATRPSYNALEMDGRPEDRIDRERRVIKGVKIIGLRSTNKARVLGISEREFGKAIDEPYRYDVKALEAAIPLYEGVKVYVDHLQSSIDASGRRVIEDRDRSIKEQFGWLSNVRIAEDGLYGDLEYLEAHPLAEQVLETISRRPDQLGLSHNSFIQPKLINGEVVVVEIGDVKSVDLIGEKPGTTTNIFESQAPTKGRTMKLSPRKILESVPRRTKGYRQLKAVIEMGEEEDVLAKAADADMDFKESEEAEHEPELDSVGQVKAALKAMVSAVFDDDSLDAAATMAKIKDILAAQDKLLGKPEAAAPVSEAMHEEDEDEDDKAAVEAAHEEEDADKKAVAESKARQRAAADRERVSVLESRETAREELEDAGLNPSMSQVRTYAAIESNSDKDDFVDTLKEVGTKKQAHESHIEPRSYYPATKDELDDFKAPDGKKFAASLR